MKNLYIFIFVVFVLILWNCTRSQEVQTGLDRVDEYKQLFTGKHVGIVTNHTACTRNGKHIGDVFAEKPGVEVSALFSPEHGIRGQADAGEKIKSQNSPLDNVPVYSLYGKTNKPTAEMLKNVDVLVFDIQDIGARFYTYIWTMALSMEAAAENHIPFIVLDRPNPINGVDIEGTVLDTAFATFVGLYPIAVRHGMTVGELAELFNGEGWLKDGVKADLTVIKMKNWQRAMWYDQTGLPFIKPSPNMPDLATATVYPGMCLIEGTNVSEGRGTETPFLVFGAPWINSQEFISYLNDLGLPGIRFEEEHFTPVSIPGKSTYPKYQDKNCNGAQVIITDRQKIQPYFTGIKIVETLYQLYPDSLRFNQRHFDRLCGTDRIRKAILNDVPDRDVLLEKLASLNLEQFKSLRQKYLLY